MFYRICLVAVVVCIVPQLVDARHTDRVDTSDLDDDVVETFPIPVLFGVEYDDLVSDFGDPRSGGREHEGQDFRAPLGTPIVSPTEAVVLRTGTGASAGKYVYTRNPGGETFRYMHLDEIADIERGDELDVGDFIGTVGDTGNAPSGVYHLHFETRDEDNDAQDPYPRLEETFTLKEKLSFLRGILRNYDGDEDEYAELLVETFPNVFTAALIEEYSLPDEFDDVLEDSDILVQQRLLTQLQNVIDMIPGLLTRTLAVGDSGTEVSLLQTYLLFRSDGPARDRLAGAGATGYYGSITTAAVEEYQEATVIENTGTLTPRTREVMRERRGF